MKQKDTQILYRLLDTVMFCWYLGWETEKNSRYVVRAVVICQTSFDANLILCSCKPDSQTDWPSCIFAQTMPCHYGRLPNKSQPNIIVVIINGSRMQHGTRVGMRGIQQWHAVYVYTTLCVPVCDASLWLFQRQVTDVCQKPLLRDVPGSNRLPSRS